jgi:hypothetical protein
MVWTYAPYLLTSATGTTAAMQKVRVLIGDTDDEDQQLDDEVLYYILGAQSTLTYAAAAAADILASKYARKTNVTIGETRVTNERIYYHYNDLADRLRASGPGDIPGGDGSNTIQASMYVGGSSVAAKEAFDSDTDNSPTSFRLGQDDFDGVDTDPDDVLGEQ